ncbi:hypothetical protein ACJZ2D_007647 [Fusarium nematophilum]
MREQGRAQNPTYPGINTLAFDEDGNLLEDYTRDDYVLAREKESSGGTLRTRATALKDARAPKYILIANGLDVFPTSVPRHTILTNCLPFRTTQLLRSFAQKQTSTNDVSTYLGLHSLLPNLSVNSPPGWLPVRSRVNRETDIFENRG